MIEWLIGGAVALVVVLALLAPLESLRWWSQRGAVEATRTLQLVRDDAPAPSGVRGPRRYVVYLSGIGVVDGQAMSGRERQVWQRVSRELPEVCVLGEVFPYAADNRGLPRRRAAPLWLALISLRRRRRGSIAPNLINLRNVLQVLVSTDPRYGPSLNTGVAMEIWRVLRRHGYPRGGGVPVTVVGYSGGAQMAIGSASVLSLLGVPVDVVSVGGVFAADRGLDQIRHLWDLRGSRDRVRRLALIAFPGRLPVMRSSPWNRALREGRVTVVDMGPVGHHGRSGYWVSTVGPDSPADRLVATLVGILADGDPVDRTLSP